MHSACNSSEHTMLERQLLSYICESIALYSSQGQASTPSPSSSQAASVLPKLSLSMVQVAIRLLLECAIASPETQFILLSPQNVDAIRHAVEDVQNENIAKGQAIPAPDVFTKIVEMRPARTGSQAA